MRITQELIDNGYGAYLGKSIPNQERELMIWKHNLKECIERQKRLESIIERCEKNLEQDKADLKAIEEWS